MQDVTISVCLWQCCALLSVYIGLIVDFNLISTYFTSILRSFIFLSQTQIKRCRADVPGSCSSSCRACSGRCWGWPGWAWRPGQELLWPGSERRPASPWRRRRPGRSWPRGCVWARRCCSSWGAWPPGRRAGRAARRCWAWWCPGAGRGAPRRSGAARWPWWRRSWGTPGRTSPWACWGSGDELHPQ